MVNQKLEENFALKQLLDQKRLEMEKQKKKMITLEELVESRNLDSENIKREL